MDIEEIKKIVFDVLKEAGLAVDSVDGKDAVVEEIKSGKYDLIIKAANHHGVLDSIIFTPIDWYILRNSQIPVYKFREQISRLENIPSLRCRIKAELIIRAAVSLEKPDATNCSRSSTTVSLSLHASTPDPIPSERHMTN